METELVQHQNETGECELYFKLEHTGLYRGTVKYNSKTVGAGDFTIICLEGKSLLITMIREILKSLYMLIVCIFMDGRKDSPV